MIFAYGFVQLGDKILSIPRSLFMMPSNSPDLKNIYEEFQFTPTHKLLVQLLHEKSKAQSKWAPFIGQ